jgi:predicted ATP-dependent endonuclease of OLD family
MTSKVKDKIIELVRRMDDEQTLEQVFSILDSKDNYPQGKLWEMLTEEEKNETLLSLEESEREENTIPNEEVMKNIRQKFGWD